MKLRYLGTGLALAALLSCESTTAPGGVPALVAGDTIALTLAAGDSGRSYSLSVPSQQAFALYVQVARGAVQFLFQERDGKLAPFAPTYFAGNQPLLTGPPYLLSFPADVNFNIQVSPYPADSSAQIRFLLYHVSNAPEGRAADFAIGDTVTESVDPGVDVDVFTTTGQVGQHLIAVLQQLAPAFGGVQLSILDPTGTQRGFTNVSGNGDMATTGPVAGGSGLPVAGEYSFTVRSNPVPGSQYRGAYRFWTYLVNPAPEHRPAAASFNTAITGESIDRAGDVDEFTFQATAGMLLDGFIQSARPIQLEIANAAATLSALSSYPGDTALFDHPTGRIVIPTAGTWIARVSGLSPTAAADTMAYRLYLYQVNPAPEHAPAVIVPGDTVSESIDQHGDLDQFSFTANSGAQYAVFLQSQTLNASTQLHLDVIDADGSTQLGFANSIGTDTGLYGQTSGVFTIHTSGAQRIAVSGAGNASVGPYRLRLVKINPAPESVPDSIVLGDSVFGETLDIPGDYDDFRFTIPLNDSGAVNLAVEPAPTGPAFPIVATITNVGTQAVVGVASGGYATGALFLPHGNYVVRVSSGGLPQPRAAYRLWLYHIQTPPETRSAVFSTGDTVGDALDPPGDVDVYRFNGVRGQHLNLMAMLTASTGSGGVVVQVNGDGVHSFSGIGVTSGTVGGQLQDHQSLRFELPYTGSYTVRASGNSALGAMFRGAYRFTLASLSSAPETAPAALAVGDSVTTESIDTRGDWDDFTATATPGQELGIVFGTTVPFGAAGAPLVRAIDPTTGDTLAFTGAVGTRFAGPFKAPASGQLQISVFQQGNDGRTCGDSTCNNTFPFLGPYALRLVAINRSPEHVPAAVVPGDTLRGEDLTYGDIDEYTGSGTPGDSMSAHWHLLADVPPVPTYTSSLYVQVFDGVTGVALTPLSFYNLASPLFASTPFVVPASGQYIVRVFGYGSNGDEVAAAPYELFVKRGP